MPHNTKTITLMGMSGVGKTHFSLILKQWGWGHYSCDVEIGKDLLDTDAELKPDDIRVLMEYLGLLGDPAQGGMPYEEFIKRQKFYKIAEMHSLLKLKKKIRRCDAPYFVNDSTGSLCEITDHDVIDFVGENTKIVYIKASGDEEKALLDRAENDPKPIYYPPTDFKHWIDEYLQRHDLQKPDDMIPQDFARWVFPMLLQARKPKYQAIADQYGITIASSDLHAVDSEQAFLELIKL